MKTRKLHRLLGLTLLAPLIVWAITGMVFLVQPGYGSAYAVLEPRTYPLVEPLVLPASNDWLEYRVLRTILGEHLLVKTDAAWLHLDKQTLEAAPLPVEEKQTELLSDAITVNPERYGEVSRYENGAFHTSTGVEISLNWNTLSFRQYGEDTYWIDRLYRLHYLQWTGIRWLDRVLGISGLLLLIFSSVTGIQMVMQTKPDQQRS